MRGTNCAMTQPCARDINRRKRARCPVLATLVPCHYTSKEQREKSMEMFFLPDANGETSSLTTICYEHESNVYIYIYKFMRFTFMRTKLWWLHRMNSWWKKIIYYLLQFSSRFLLPFSYYHWIILEF